MTERESGRQEREEYTNRLLWGLGNKREGSREKEK